MESVQVPFLIVQRNVLTPALRPLTPDVGEFGAVTTPEPAMIDQAPVPTSGVLPASVAVAAQTSWSEPAAAAVGGSSRMIVMSSVESAQVPLLIVQRKVLAPTLRPVTPDVGEPGVSATPEPAMVDQAPVPTVAVLPSSVAVVAQSF